MNRGYKTNLGHGIAEDSIFTDKIIGEMGRSINANDALVLGCTLGTMLGTHNQHLVIVGQDNRNSSESLEAELCRGIGASGCYVMQAGIVPYPVVLFSAFCLNAASVMISGEGKPFDYNGFKFGADQLPIYGERLNRIVALCSNGSWRYEKAGILPGDIHDIYVKTLKRIIDIKGSCKIVWDLCSGTATRTISELTNEIPGEHLLMNDQYDGHFGGIPPDCYEEQRVSSVQEVLLEEKCDLGLIMNADCSQFSLVDNEGTLWSRAQTIAYLLEDLLLKYPDSRIALGIDCGHSIFQTVSSTSAKIDVIPAGVGPLMEHIRENPDIHFSCNGDGVCVFGHKFQYVNIPDPIFTALNVIKLLNQKGQPLSESLEHLSKEFSKPDQYYPTAQPESIIQAIRKNLLLTQKTFYDSQGIRLNHNTGFWWLRKTLISGKSYLILSVQAISERACDQLVAEVEGYLNLVSLDEKIIQSDPYLHQTREKSVEKDQKPTLKDISDDDREQIDFASRHWSSIDKNQPKIEPRKSTRPWKRISDEDAI